MRKGVCCAWTEVLAAAMAELVRDGSSGAHQSEFFWTRQKWHRTK